MVYDRMMAGGYVLIAIAAFSGVLAGAGICYVLLVRQQNRFIERSSHDPADRERIAREAILRALARAARLLFNATDKEAVMTDALGALGEAVGVDRVYVFENHRHPRSGELLASQRFEWCGPGIRPEIDNEAMQNMSYDRVIPNWRPILESGAAVHGVVRNFEPTERRLLQPQNIQSIIVVPIFLDGEFWGQIGFDDCSRERQWSRAEIDALEVAAGTIGGAIRSMRAEDKLRRLVSTDSLTGLASRRAFLEEARASFERAIEENGRVALLIMDLDRFKSINDNHGHPVGDEALKVFARTCRRTFRDDDLIGRTGGEEFAVLLRGVDIRQARALAERLRRAVENMRLELASGNLAMSVSVGVADPGGEDADFAQVLKQADDALYIAKREGRNQVRVAGQSE